MWLMAILLLVMSALLASSEVYKRPDGKGRTVLRDVPCTLVPDEGAPLPSSPPPSTDSAGLTDWETMCKNAGQTASEFAKARDRGATYTQLLAGMRRVLAEQAQFRQIFEPVYTTMLRDIFERRWLTPAMAQQQMEFACIQGISQSQR